MTPRQAIITGLILFILSVQVLGLAILALFPYVPDPGFSGLNTYLYAFLAPLSTIFLLGLLYAWLISLGTREARHKSQRFERFAEFLSEPFRPLISSIKTRSLSDSARTSKILSHPRLLLAVSLAAPLYVTWINQMLAKPVPQALQYSFVEGLDGSRPLLLVILYALASLGVSPTQIIEHLPIVRLWGGYYANMLALVFAYLFLTLLLLFSKSPSIPKYCAMFALSVALFLTHPWTWVLIATVGLVFALSLWRETHILIHLKSIAGIVIAGVALDVLKSTLFATRTVAADLATKLPTSADPSAFWVNLVDGLLYTHSGLLGSWIILGVGLFACFALRFKDWFERLVLLWVGVASIPFLILDSYNQTRIIYDLPIPVLMATALLFFLPVIGTKNIRWPGIIILLIFVICANYALQGILLL